MVTDSIILSAGYKKYNTADHLQFLRAVCPRLAICLLRAYPDDSADADSVSGTSEVYRGGDGGRLREGIGKKRFAVKKVPQISVLC